VTRLHLVVAMIVVVGGCRRDVDPLAVHPATETVGSAAYPITIRDDLGRTITLARRPERIVTLLPSHTETVYALGAGGCVVGVDDYSDHPPEVAALPKLGGQFDTPLESIHSLRPDLILASEAASSIRALERSGLLVWAGSARHFEDVFRVIDAIGRMIDRPSEAKRLVERMHCEIDGIERVLREPEPVTVYYELDPSPYTVGPSSFIGVMLAKAGGANIVGAELGDFPKSNPELVVSADPAVILGATLDAVATRPGWNRIAAVRAGRVEKLPPSEAAVVARPGPRLADGLRALARRLHPGAFP